MKKVQMKSAKKGMKRPNTMRRGRNITLETMIMAINTRASHTETTTKAMINHMTRVMTEATIKTTKRVVIMVSLLITLAMSTLKKEARVGITKKKTGNLMTQQTRKVTKKEKTSLIHLVKSITMSQNKSKLMLKISLL